MKYLHGHLQGLEDPSLDGHEPPREERDLEAEHQLLEGVSGDPLAAYDVDVREEGRAIQDYLDRLASMQSLSEQAQR